MKNLFRKGIAHFAVLLLLAGVASLTATVLVMGDSRLFFNQAFQKQGSWSGVVEKVSPCVNRTLCYRLIGTEDGRTYYLLAQNRILPMIPSVCLDGGSWAGCGFQRRFGSKIGLSKFVGMRVKVVGQLMKTAKTPYIFVSSVSKIETPPISDQTSLSVTEIGVVMRRPIPAASGAQLGVSSENYGQTEASMGVSGPAGVVSRPCLSDVSGKPVCQVPASYDSCKDGELVDVPGTDECGCALGPICRRLSDNPGPVPGECVPPPPCVKQGCLIAPPEGKQWCGDVLPVPSEAYELKTEDGRTYLLFSGGVKECKSYPCPLMPTRNINWEQYVGKTVLVEGTMQQSGGDVCIQVYPKPPGCGKIGWWPLPSGLDFEVRRVQLAKKIESGTYAVTFKESTSEYAKENIYVAPNPNEVGKPTYLRSSYFDLASYIDKKVQLTGTVFYVGSSPDKFINVEKVVSVVNPISWVTDSKDVTLFADSFYVEANGVKFYGDPQSLTLHSDPPDSGDPNYTTLEATWKENGTEMRIYMYFYKDSSQWWTKEIRTYDGKSPGDWVYFKNYSTFPKASVGSEFVFNGSYFLHHINVPNEPGNVTIYFRNLRIRPFARG